MKISKHAEGRMRQRGIQNNNIYIALLHGRPIKQPGGATKYFLGKKECQQEIAARKQEIQLLEKAKGLNVVVSADGVLLTTYKN